MLLGALLYFGVLLGFGLVLLGFFCCCYYIGVSWLVLLGFGLVLGCFGGGYFALLVVLVWDYFGLVMLLFVVWCALVVFGVLITC